MHVYFENKKNPSITLRILIRLAFYSVILSILIHVHFEKKNVLIIFADFSMGETKEGERRGLFTRYDFGVRRYHLGCLAARYSVLQSFLMQSVQDIKRKKTLFYNK